MSSRGKSTVFLPTAMLASTCLADPIEIWGTEYFGQPIEVSENEKFFVFADLNADAYRDLAVAQDSGDEVVVFLGSADNRFRRFGRFPAGHDPGHLAASDIDADGNIDIVVSNHDTPQLTLLLGNGHGNLEAAPNSPLSTGVRPHVHVALVRDLNNDAIVDLLVDHRDGRGVLALAGLGDGAFDGTGRLVDMGGDPYRGMAIGDINGDGRPDLATPNPDHVGIALNTSAAGISFELIPGVEVASPFAVEFADVDADGVLDLIVATDGAASALHTLIGDGQGRFAGVDGPVPMRPGAKSVAVADFDGDGVSDVLAISWSGDAVTARGGSDSRRTARISLEGIENPWGMAVSDINGDGKDDFVIADGVRPVAYVYVSRDNDP